MEIFRALGALVEAPRSGLELVASSLELGELPSVHEHTELFALQLVPFASIYLDEEGRIGGEARDRICGFWRALDVDPAGEADHLTVLLSSYAELSEAERRATSAPEARARSHHREVFLREHLVSWLPAYLIKLREIAPPFYRRWSDLLRDALGRELERRPAKSVPSVHHRLTQDVSPSGDDSEDLLSSLLAPIRSGFILTRSDLAGASRALGIGSRLGERRFMLEAMLRQDPTGLAGRLCGICDSTLRSYAHEDTLAAWRERLAITRRRLLEVA